MNSFLNYGTFFLILQFLNLTGASELLKILPDKPKQTKFVGNAFFVGCESTGKNVQRVMWTGPDGKQITNYMDRIHVEDGKSGHKGVDLVFENITRKDRGNYTCSANVDGTEVSKTFELIVFKPINFVNSPKEQFLTEGIDSTVKCTVEGDPAPNVNWRYNGKRVKWANTGSKYTHHPESPSWIVVKNATMDDGGKFTCVAVQLSSSTSEIEMHNIKVIVRHQPRETPEHVDEYYSYLSGVVNLTCTVIAEPSPNFTWIKDDVQLAPSEHVHIFNLDKKSILMLNMTDENMFGDYYCKAENRLGTLERVVSLEKGIKPAVPNPQITLAKETEFHMNLTTQNQPEMPLVGYKVEYKRPKQDWIDASVKELEYGKPYILDGLKDNTLYVMRVSSKNIAGYSDHSKEILQKTKKMGSASTSAACSLTKSSLIFAIIIFTIAEISS